MGRCSRACVGTWARRGAYMEGCLAPKAAREVMTSTRVDRPTSAYLSGSAVAADG